MDWTAFEEFLLRTMQEENIPGMAVGVSHKGQIIYQKGFGKRNVMTGQPVSPNTVFGIASITKSFTALAIMQLAEQGKLAVTDAVTAYLPEFLIRGVRDMSTIKIHHLLSHTSGIPPLRRRQHLTNFTEHLQSLASEDIVLLGPPGEFFSYCNDAFMLLGAIIDRVTGTNYRAYILDNILRPLNLTSSTYDIDELRSFEDVSTPYVFNKDTGALEETLWPVLNNYQVGGGIRSCVPDLLKYGQAYTGGSSLVAPDTAAAMYRPVYTLQKNYAYCYALKVTQNHHGVTLVEHGGGLPGVSSHFGFIPERELVAAVLTNVKGVSASRIWLAAVNTWLSLPLQHSGNILPEAESPSDSNKYVGLYQSEEGGKISVRIKDTALVLEQDGKSYELHHTGDTSFFFDSHKHQIVRFYLDSEGKPWAALVGMRMLRRREGGSEPCTISY